MAETLGRAEILRRRRDVERVMKSGLKLVGPALCLCWAPLADTPPPGAATQPESRPTCGSPRCTAPARRVAILVPGRPHGAVMRNRLKRWMREIYRRNKRSFPAGSDYVLQLTARGSRTGFDELRAITAELACRLPSNG